MTLKYDKCPACGKPFATCEHSIAEADLGQNIRDLKGSPSAYPAIPQGVVLVMCPKCIVAVPKTQVKRHEATHKSIA